MAWKSFFCRYPIADVRTVEWQIHCTTCGCAETQPGKTYPPFSQNHPTGYTRNLTSGRIIDEYQLIYVSKGKGEFQNEVTGTVRLHAGHVIVILPGIRHSYHPDVATGWDEYWIGFAGPYADHLARSGFLDRSHPVHDVGYSETLVHEYIRALEIAYAQAPGYQLELAAAATGILAKILVTIDRNREPSVAQKMVQRAKFLMEESILETLDLDSITAKLGVPYHAFLEQFKHETGMTPYHYFLELKIHYAKQLLRDSRYTVQEVAYHLTFQDQFYFSRLFKKKTGVCPTEWRRRGIFPPNGNSG